MAAPTTPGLTQFDADAAQAATVIDPMDINNEYIRLPNDLATWNSVYADAVEQLLKAKLSLEVGEEEIRGQWRAKLQGEGAKITEGYLDECVTRDARYRVLRETANQAEVLKVRAAGVIGAIEAKRDMLVSLGANLRAEMQPAPSIRTREARLER